MARRLIVQPQSHLDIMDNHLDGPQQREDELTLEELGWKLQDAGNIKAWDGLQHWFLDYVAAHSSVIVNASLRRWHRAAKFVVAVV